MDVTNNIEVSLKGEDVWLAVEMGDSNLDQIGEICESKRRKWQGTTTRRITSIATTFNDTDVSLIYPRRGVHQMKLNLRAVFCLSLRPRVNTWFWRDIFRSYVKRRLQIGADQEIINESSPR